jgi:hypothetical protein
VPFRLPLDRHLVLDCVFGVGFWRLGEMGWMSVFYIGFVEVSRKVWGVDPVREDKYVAARGFVSMGTGTVDCLF